MHKCNRIRRVLICMVIMFCMSVISTMGVYAVGEVNDVTGSQSGQSSVSEESSQASSIAGGLSQAFGDVALSDEDIANASEFVSPYVRIVNNVIAAVLACFSVIIGAVTILDLLYIGCPPIRGILMPQQSQSNGMSGMGMGMRGMGGMQQDATLGSKVGRFVSDEAVAAVAEATPTPTAGGMGIGMGGFGMQQAQPKKTKSLILSYVKKRSFALICFFACLVLFTSTVFTDLGLYIGQWIIDFVSSLF